jgi:membrane protein YdbS with pleckstrin-like domain
VLAGAVGLVVAAMAADPPVVPLAAALAGVAALGAVVALVAPPIAYRSVRFEVTPLGLLVQTGIVVRSLTIVPHSRIQSVQTTTDPLQRAMGLATVEVRTASSAFARVPGLDAARVDRLRDDLAAMAGTGEAT